MFEIAEDFDDLNAKIVEKILSFKEQNIVYCVDGNGADDRSVILLAEYANVHIIPSVSREMTALKNYPSVSYVTVSAYDINNDFCFNYDKNLPLIVKEIDNIFIAGEIKEILSRIVGEEQEIYVNYTADGENQEQKILVYELDRLSEYNYTFTVYVPPIELTCRKQNDYTDLLRIMRKLRGKNGCEWDKAQSHESIRKNAIEEAYELVDAIDNQDIDNIIEEAGDVILQGVFHAVIGEDEGEFTANEVMTALCHKLISRHTHIFGDIVANNAEEALRAWENAKATEKKTNTAQDKLKRISRALPSCMRAVKAQKIASKIGLEFESIEEIVKKINEELFEFNEATADDKEMEGGDLLFAVINLLRFYGYDSETALNKSVNKFIARTVYVEQKLRENGIKNITPNIIDEYWEESKKQKIGAREEQELFEYVSYDYEEDDEDFEEYEGDLEEQEQ